MTTGEGCNGERRFCRTMYDNRVDKVIHVYMSLGQMDIDAHACQWFSYQYFCQNLLVLVLVFVIV